MGRILGVDFGMARIGLAISDESQQIALPLKTISGSKSYKTAAKNLADSIKELHQDVSAIVIGHPKSMSGRNSNMTLLVEEFAREVEELTSMKVLLWDERLSSAHAEREMKGMQMNRKKRAKKIDMIAACLILQSYLDNQS